MFGLAHLVVSAERELRDKGVKSYQETRPEPQVRLWLYRTLFLVIGALALLIISGKGA